MESLIRKSNRKIHDVPVEFTRYLLDEINPKNRINIIKGARGAGKTTLLLQYAKIKLPADVFSLYVSLDDIYFYSNSLYELAENFYKENGKYLLLDEVHKYPNWSRELKLIYDDFPELQILATSSSLLEIYKAESDLSRRAVQYQLKELSFREFLYFETKQLFPVFSLEEILKNHENIALEFLSIKPVFQFKNFTRYGAYPFFLEEKENYYDKLLHIIDLVLETDLPSVERIDFEYITKLKKLLFAIATSAPFTPNISKLAQRTGISRNALVKALFYLEKARLIILLRKNNKGISLLSKPDKIFMNNPNLQYALAEEHTNTGTVRESIFVNQLLDLHRIAVAEKGDFLVDDKYTFEIGGKNKNKYQIKGLDNAYIVRDDYETGVFNTIPLWLFGFLY